MFVFFIHLSVRIFFLGWPQIAVMRKVTRTDDPPSFAGMTFSSSLVRSDDVCAHAGVDKTFIKEGKHLKENIFPNNNRGMMENLSLKHCFVLFVVFFKKISLQKLLTFQRSNMALKFRIHIKKTWRCCKKKIKTFIIMNNYYNPFEIMCFNIQHYITIIIKHHLFWQMLQLLHSFKTESKKH